MVSCNKGTRLNSAEPADAITCSGAGTDAQHRTYHCILGGGVPNRENQRSLHNIVVQVLSDGKQKKHFKSTQIRHVALRCHEASMRLLILQSDDRVLGELLSDQDIAEPAHKPPMPTGAGNNSILQEKAAGSKSSRQLTQPAGSEEGPVLRAVATTKRAT